MSDQCVHCKNDLPPSAVQCPHCAWPGNYPNVRAAEHVEETRALDRRCQEALDRARSAGLEDKAKDLEAALSTSKAVISCSLLEVQNLVFKEDETFSTYHQKVLAGIKWPQGGKWDLLRMACEASIFPGYYQHIRFGALSLDGMGLKNYGNCYLVVKDDMIAHRASVFEENNVLLIINLEIQAGKLHDLPKGFRSTWQRRCKLGMAKFADQVGTCKNFSELLLKNGKTTQDDDFIEVHIYGPMTARTFETMRIKKRETKGARTIIKAMQEKLSKTGVTMEII